MNPFNVTIMQPPGYVHILAVLEAAEYIHRSLVRAGFESELTTNAVKPGRHNIVFGCHLLGEEALEQFPVDTILFNSEQISDRAGWHFDGPYRKHLDRFFIWDYSLRNSPRSCPGLARVRDAKVFHVRSDSRDSI